MIRQFVAQEFCLKCRSCCRFKETNSVWSPCLLDEEIQELVDRPGIPAVSVSVDRRIQAVADPGSARFICPFLNSADNQCRIYDMRPFECQLYPFLINLRKGKVLLTVDLNCPYVVERINTPEMGEYIAYISSYLNSPKQLKMLKDNPQIIQAYEEVREVAELRLPP